MTALHLPFRHRTPGPLPALPCCAECRHWRGLVETPDEGDCRRFPPTLQPAVEGAYRPSSRSRSEWPRTGHADWCGEFSPCRPSLE